MADSFVWRFGHSGDWNDPSNWFEFSGTRSADELRSLAFQPGGRSADRAPGAGDDVVFPALSTLNGPVTGGGAADTVVLQDDGSVVQLAGTGTEHYTFREVFVRGFGSNLALSDALLDTQATYISDTGFLDVSQGAVGTDPDGRSYTASLGALRLEALPGLSGPPSTPAGGRLILGDHDVDVTSLVQGALGVGNSFDPHVGIIGSGEIQFPAAVSPAMPYVTTPFTPFAPPSFGLNLPPRLDHIDFGTVHAGGTETLTFTVANVAGEAAQPLLGAVQTAVNGGHITDAALSGSGVVPGNFYLPPDVTRQDFTVTLTGDSPHTLDSQAVHLAFADGTGVTLPITGTVVDETSLPSPAPIDWNALAEQATANFAASGQWFLGEGG